MSKKILDMINGDLRDLSNGHATGNAHGFPITECGNITLDSTGYLIFKESLILNDETAGCLREIAEIIEKYY